MLRTSIVARQAKKESWRRCSKAMHAEHADNSAQFICMGHAFDREARLAKRNTHRPGCLLSCALAPCCCLADHVPGQAAHLAVICVFCVHRLTASALEFLLCNAADKRLRTYCCTGDSADARSIASDGIEPIAIGQRFHATVTILRRNGLPIRLYWRDGWISLWPPGLRRCVPLATTGQNHCAEVLAVGSSIHRGVERM